MQILGGGGRVIGALKRQLQSDVGQGAMTPGGFNGIKTLKKRSVYLRTVSHQWY